LRIFLALVSGKPSVYAVRNPFLPRNMGSQEFQRRFALTGSSKSTVGTTGAGTFAVAA
jgi:hypothetical protein